LTTAFLNILDNACKYSSEAVSVQLQTTADKILVVVSDHGRGIAEADVAHIFDPLYRGKNVDGVPGFGIGLAMTQKIIELHQGFLHLNSKINEGTIVSISFPSLN